MKDLDLGVFRTSPSSTQLEDAESRMALREKCITEEDDFELFFILCSDQVEIKIIAVEFLPCCSWPVDDLYWGRRGYPEIWSGGWLHLPVFSLFHKITLTILF